MATTSDCRKCKVYITGDSSILLIIEEASHVVRDNVRELCNVKNVNINFPIDGLVMAGVSFYDNKPTVCGALQLMET